MISTSKKKKKLGIRRIIQSKQKKLPSGVERNWGFTSMFKISVGTTPTTVWRGKGAWGGGGCRADFPLGFLTSLGFFVEVCMQRSRSVFGWGRNLYVAEKHAKLNEGDNAFRGIFSINYRIRLSAKPPPAFPFSFSFSFDPNFAGE